MIERIIKTMKIHNHITPQEYLKHFATKHNPDLIWRFNIRKGTWEELPIMRAGQRKDFFPPELEQLLSEKVEGPAISHLNKLREKQCIDMAGRLVVAQYVTVMIARTERMRMRMADSMSQDIGEALQDPEEAARKWNLRIAPMCMSLLRIEDSMQGDPLRTKEPALRQVLGLPGVLDHIMRMNWQVFTVDTADGFLTSDHPVFVSKTAGLKHENAEFMFALASDTALVGNWKLTPGELDFQSANSRFTKEFNRHIVSAAENWIYFHKKAKWVNKVVQNPSTIVGREAF